MKVLLFLAKGFETMEFSAFVDVLGWARYAYHYDIDVITCGFSKTVLSTFNVPVIVDQLVDEVYVDDYDALAIPGGFEEFGFYEEAYDKKLLDLIRKFNEKRKTRQKGLNSRSSSLFFQQVFDILNTDYTVYRRLNTRKQKKLR